MSQAPQAPHAPHAPHASPHAPSPARAPRLAVIGGGLTGAAVARHARAQLNAEVTVFDKGRAPGGRLSTREMMGARFDMGSPWIHAQGGAWREALMSVPGVGVELIKGEGGEGGAGGEGLSVWSAPEGMRAVVLAALRGAHLVSSTKIENIEREGEEWWLRGARHDSDERAWGPFDWVVLTIPAPQAARLLLSHLPDWGRAALKTRYSPQWSVGVLFERALNLNVDMYLGEGGGPFAVCRRAVVVGAEGAEGAEEAWVLQSSAEWARERLELRAEMAAELLVDEWARVVGPLPSRVCTHGHRWRYSRVEGGGGAPLLDAALRLGVCGDWRSGPNAGDAYLGGVQLVEMIGRAL
jgi:renalase